MRRFANVAMHGRAGLIPKIIRKAEHKCCEWCSKLAGVYEYPEVPDEVYQRHERCRCTVDYDPGNGKRQNVHTKQWKTEQKRDTLKLKKIKSTERGMANGPRRGRLTTVSPAEELYIRQEAVNLGIPVDLLRFNAGGKTSFNETLMVINIRGDIFPSEYAPNIESILNVRCALAHE